MQNADGTDKTNEPSASEEVPAAADETISTNLVVTPPAHSDDSNDEQASRSLGASALLARRQANNPGSSEVHSMNGGIDMPGRINEVEMTNTLDDQRTRTETPDNNTGPTAEQIISGEGPLTPRNNAGPFVFDGSAGRSAGAATGARIVSVSELTESES